MMIRPVPIITAVVLTYNNFSNDSYDSKPSAVHTDPLTGTHTAPKALPRKVMVMICMDRLRPLRTKTGTVLPPTPKVL